MAVCKHEWKRVANSNRLECAKPGCGVIAFRRRWQGKSQRVHRYVCSVSGCGRKAIARRWRGTHEMFFCRGCLAKQPDAELPAASA